jgi:hypothetical protein
LSNNNGSEPITPIENYDVNYIGQIGLTKLEHFAGLAMQGYIAADTEFDNDSKATASWAVENSKALLKELEKHQ